MRMKNSLLALGLVITSLTFVLAGCGNSTSSTSSNSTQSSPGKPQHGGAITIAYPVDITNFDPLKGTTGNDFALLYPVYDTLIKLSAKLKPEPELATSWSMPNSKTIILNLRKGVTFQDGTPFNAAAVKFNIDRANSPQSLDTELNDVKSVQIINNYTVELHLSQPDSSILLSLGERAGMMVSPTAIKKYGNNYPQHPVGAGPFEVTKHIPNGEIVYTAYKHYWDKGHPYLHQITVKVIPDANSEINALMTGQVDFVPGVAPQMVAALKKKSNIVLSETNSLGFQMLYLDTGKKPFNNKAVRLAVLYGINRSQLVNAINFGLGVPTSQPFPKGYWAYDKNINIPYDPQKSKQLLKTAGLTHVSFTLLTYPIAIWENLANAIKGQLANIGINVTVQTMEPNAAVQQFLVNKNYSSLTGNWGGTPDPQMTIDGLFSTTSLYNTGKSMTPKLKSLLSEVNSTYNQAKLAKLYGQIDNEAIVKQGFIIPLFTTLNINAMDQRIHGFTPSLGATMFANLWVN
ncbi:ABC transporter substrate-binding protein [Alicyclobacillus sp. ALC3]|uniref:ABC transporter substrate-binding protein n=1 Tax=Alicyclobacillus sp. ALC3 TaxID=2796143 RepID=UPI0023787DA8|nr:ABC transporter substrate-binding protein [Alicyclobacillus sp. ALC3]WDL97683.1 ABC transporter substrate-binding protein [Alicyclobacillus sp. ALC3]